MDVARMETKVRAYTGVQATALLSKQDVIDYLNEVYFEVLSWFDWPFLTAEATFDTVAGQADYSLSADAVASDVKHVQAMSVRGGQRRRVLEPVRQVDLDESLLAGLSGVPQLVVVGADGDTVSLDPVPAGVETVTVTYLKQVPELAADADVPVFADEYHPMLVYGASVRVLDREGDDGTLADRFQREYEAMLQRMKRAEFGWHGKGLRRLGRKRSRRGSLGPMDAGRGGL